MKPEEILSNLDIESIVCIGGNNTCLTLVQFREIIITAVTSMKINYVQSLIEQGFVYLVDDMNDDVKQYSNFLSDGVMINSNGEQYKFLESGEPFTISDFQWFNSGEDCKILQPGEKWQEGELRLRITAEFVPKESSTDRPIEPSLDEFRE